MSKGIKIAAYLLAITIIIGICSLIYSFVMFFVPVNDKIEVAEFSKVYQNINSLDISLSSASLTIVEGEELSVEAKNLPAKLNISEDNKTLRISMNKSFANINSGSIKITIPSKLKRLKLKAGAGSIDISNIEVDKAKIELGLGNSVLDRVTFNKADIDGGAGNIEITDSKLTDLDLDAGAGRLHISSYLYGDNSIECGVGSSSITLLGGEDSYKIKAKKGLGSLTINGKSYGDEINYGEGKNTLKIDGGVGEINIRFRK